MWLTQFMTDKKLKMQNYLCIIMHACSIIILSQNCDIKAFYKFFKIKKLLLNIFRFRFRMCTGSEDS